MHWSSDAALFVVAFLSSALPGPCAVVTASRTLRGGIPAGLRVTLGVLAGVAAMLVFAFGTILGALVVVPRILDLMQWVGVAIIFGLAVAILRNTERAAATSVAPRHRPAGDLVTGVLAVFSSQLAFVFLLALLPQFMRDGSSDIAWALVGAAALAGGALAAQAGAIAFGALSLHNLGARARWVERLTALVLIAFASTAALAQVVD
jgi:threonine/homoserine/homoserine lactone efflux protein